MEKEITTAGLTVGYGWKLTKHEKRKETIFTYESTQI